MTLPFYSITLTSTMFSSALRMNNPVSSYPPPTTFAPSDMTMLTRTLYTRTPGLMGTCTKSIALLIPTLRTRRSSTKVYYSGRLIPTFFRSY